MRRAAVEIVEELARDRASHRKLSKVSSKRSHLKLHSRQICGNLQGNTLQTCLKGLRINNFEQLLTINELYL
jgi:hypothetical protein